MNKNILRTAIHSALGVAALASSSMASATVASYSWNGILTILDPHGQALSNTSLNFKTDNRFQDNISGTLSFDDATGVGSVNMSSFEWGSGTLPMVATSFNLQAVGDGLGGSGSLIIGNMLFDWNGNTGMPVSIVLDASGFLSGEFTSGGPMGAIPASDGTYVGAYVPGVPSTNGGYLQLGSVPMATTEWNLTPAIDCGDAKNNSTFLDNGGCLGNATSGVLPLVADTAVNSSKYDMGDGVGVGGVPIWDGPFTDFNFNIDFTEITPAVVPVPAAVWLFGSGLLGLIGLTRRKKFEV